MAAFNLATLRRGAVLTYLDRASPSTENSGCCRDWLKFKNPAAPAVKREAEEDWGKGRWQ
jgi:hypothetical protein